MGGEGRGASPTAPRARSSWAGPGARAHAHRGDSWAPAEGARASVSGFRPHDPRSLRTARAASVCDGPSAGSCGGCVAWRGGGRVRPRGTNEGSVRALVRVGARSPPRRPGPRRLSGLAGAPRAEVGVRACGGVGSGPGGVGGRATGCPLRPERVVFAGPGREARGSRRSYASCGAPVALRLPGPLARPGRSPRPQPVPDAPAPHVPPPEEALAAPGPVSSVHCASGHSAPSCRPGRAPAGCPAACPFNALAGRVSGRPPAGGRGKAASAAAVPTGVRGLGDALTAPASSTPSPPDVDPESSSSRPPSLPPFLRAACSVVRPALLGTSGLSLVPPRLRCSR